MTTSTITEADGTAPASKTVRYTAATARILMGLLFTMTGANAFLNFIPPPAGPMPEFVTAMINTRYMLPLVGATQLVVGLMLLTNLFVPLALVLIAPIIVNIVGFHLFVAPAGTGMAVFVLVLEIFLVWAYRQSYRTMAAMRARPA